MADRAVTCKEDLIRQIDVIEDVTVRPVRDHHGRRRRRRC